MVFNRLYRTKVKYLNNLQNQCYLSLPGPFKIFIYIYISQVHFCLIVFFVHTFFGGECIFYLCYNILLSYSYPNTHTRGRTHPVSFVSDNVGIGMEGDAAAN